MKSLLEFLGIEQIEESDKVRFEIRRKREGEVVQETEYEGVVDDKWVYLIEPMCIMNISKARIALIKTEINDSQIPLLERGRDKVVGTYKRVKVYGRNGEQKSDRVIIEPDLYQ